MKDEETGEMIADLVEHGQRAIIARGGRGGRGNSRFATPQIQHQNLLKTENQVKSEMLRLNLKY